MSCQQLKHTRVVVGQWATDWLSITPATTYKTITLIIPGNPGVVKYYSQFCEDLYKQLQGQSAVWAISHTCHTEEDPTPNSTVDREVEHKVSFIRKYVPEGYKLRLIGHSIGCQMILKSIDQILDSEDSASGSMQVELGHCYMLFPTIERMKDTPRGVSLWPVLNYCRWFPSFIASCLSILPHFVKEKVVRLFLYDGSQRTLPDSVIQSAITNTRPDMVRNMVDLAHDELLHVTEVDTAAVKRHKDRLVLYYGSADDWCPVEFREELMKKIPGVISYLCQRGIEHAFVVRMPTVMAEELSTIIDEIEGLQLVQEH